MGDVDHVTMQLALEVIKEIEVLHVSQIMLPLEPECIGDANERCIGDEMGDGGRLN